MWVLIDNYDSFTYILHHYLLQLHPEVLVFKNDEISVAELMDRAPERLILSPGPRTPAEAGITNALIAAFYDKLPILGICLGHQALGQFFGAGLQRASRPMHGKVSAILHKDQSVFAGLPHPLQVMRYHSLLLTGWSATALQPLAWTDKEELMAFQHPEYPVLGIQFHPESILTPEGFTLLQNWCRLFS